MRRDCSSLFFFFCGSDVRICTKTSSMHRYIYIYIYIYIKEEEGKVSGKRDGENGKKKRMVGKLLKPTKRWMDALSGLVTVFQHVRKKQAVVK